MKDMVKDEGKGHLREVARRFEGCGGSILRWGKSDDGKKPQFNGQQEDHRTENLPLHGAARNPSQEDQVPHGHRLWP